jgi:hypothetical protein
MTSEHMLTAVPLTDCPMLPVTPAVELTVELRKFHSAKNPQKCLTNIFSFDRGDEVGVHFVKAVEFLDRLLEAFLDNTASQVRRCLEIANQAEKDRSGLSDWQFGFNVLPRGEPELFGQHVERQRAKVFRSILGPFPVDFRQSRGFMRLIPEQCFAIIIPPPLR